MGNGKSGFHLMQGGEGIELLPPISYEILEGEVGKTCSSFLQI